MSASSSGSRRSAKASASSSSRARSRVVSGAQAASTSASVKSVIGFWKTRSARSRSIVVCRGSASSERSSSLMGMRAG